MNFNDLMTAPAHEAGAELQLNNPTTGKPTDAYIKVRGVDSPQMIKSFRALQRKIVEAARNGGDVDNFQNEYIVGSIIGWRGITDDDNNEWEYSEEKAKQLVDSSPAVASQIDKFVSNRANFTKG